MNLPAHRRRQIQNTSSRSLHFFTRHCLVFSLVNFTSLHACFTHWLYAHKLSRANPKSSGRATRFKPLSGCPALEIPALFCPALFFYSFPDMKICNSYLGLQKENMLPLVKKLEWQKGFPKEKQGLWCSQFPALGYHRAAEGTLHSPAHSSSSSLCKVDGDRGRQKQSSKTTFLL